MEHWSYRRRQILSNALFLFCTDSSFVLSYPYLSREWFCWALYIHSVTFIHTWDLPSTITAFCRWQKRSSSSLPFCSVMNVGWECMLISASMVYFTFMQLPCSNETMLNSHGCSTLRSHLIVRKTLTEFSLQNTKQSQANHTGIFGSV